MNSNSDQEYIVTPTLNTEFVRSHFPAFSQPHLREWGFFENAGGSYTCIQVINKLQTFYTETKVQPYGPYPASQRAGDAMDNTYSELSRYLNIPAEWIHIGPSTTQNIYVMAQAFLQKCSPGDEIIVTNQDHEANIGAWRQLEKYGIKVVEWQIDPISAQLRIEDLEKSITKKTRLVAFTHCSNIVGHINPVNRICEFLKDRGIISVVDGVSQAGHGFPDIKESGADIYLFSLYKTFGPHLGLMTINPAVHEYFQSQCHFFNQHIDRKKFIPAGPDHAQIASAAGIVSYFDEIYSHHFSTEESDINYRATKVRELIRQHEICLMEPLLQFINQCKKVQLIGPSDARKRHPTISLKLTTDPGEIARKLAEKQLMCSSGHFYAHRLLQALGIKTDSGILRISFVHYTTNREIIKLIEALDEILCE